MAANTMKYSPYLSLALAVLASSASAATYQITSNLDNSFYQSQGPPPVFSTTVEAPYVGNLTLSYDAENPLANGTYAWNSLTTLTLTVTFPDVSQTFTQADLDTPSADIRIQVIDGNFFFTNVNSSGTSSSLTGRPISGSANFVNSSNYLFTTQPLNAATRMGFGGYVVDYNALYQLVDLSTASGTPGQPGYTSGTQIYKGNYGNPTANASATTVPEPSAALLGCFGALALFRRNRR